VSSGEGISVAQKRKDANPETHDGMSGAPAMFTVLMGDDTVSREQAREALVARIREMRGDITMHSSGCQGDGPEQLVEQALTPSLFGGVRVFLLRHAQDLTERQVSALTPLLTAALPDEYILVEAEAPERTAKAFNALVKAARARADEDPSACAVVAFEKPPPWKIAEWVVAHAPSIMGRAVTKADAECLVDLVGDDFDALRSELEKIDLALEPGARITREAIESVVSATREAA
jgi:DNA polymerase III delta subunit